jgi:DNA-binding response OmpR family regulator
MTARILIVEDNADLLTILEEVLSANYEVETALSGEDAIRIARTFEPDLVLLDLLLPGLDGVETGQRIKEEAAPRSVPILVLTAQAETIGEERLRASGCCEAYITKPAPLSMIRAKVDELLYSHTAIT